MMSAAGGGHDADGSKALAAVVASALKQRAKVRGGAWRGMGVRL